MCPLPRLLVSRSRDVATSASSSTFPVGTLPSVAIAASPVASALTEAFPCR